MATYRTTLYVNISDFRADHDAESLHEAMSGEGTDDRMIIDILGQRSNEELQFVSHLYEKLYGKALAEDISTELDGDFKDIALALITPSGELDADIVCKSTKGFGTDEDLLLEVLCTRTLQQLNRAQGFYKLKYGKDMTKMVEDDTSGHFRKLCLALLKYGGCHEFDCEGVSVEGEVEYEAVKKDAEKLYKSGEEKLGTDEDAFIDMLVRTPYPHLRAVFAEYERAMKHGIEEAVKKEFSRDIRKGLLTLIHAIRNTPEYFAEKLHRALTKKDEDTTIRIAVSRAEMDLDAIRVEYYRLYAKRLGLVIEENTTGPYRVMLKALIRG